MGKMRNAGTDIGQLMQWFGRKCRNHHPLEEIGLKQQERKQTLDQYKAGQKGDVFAVTGSEGAILYKAGGRNFMIHAEEITEEQAQALTVQDIGY